MVFRFHEHKSITWLSHDLRFTERISTEKMHPWVQNYLLQSVTSYNMFYTIFLYNFFYNLIYSYLSFYTIYLIFRILLYNHMCNAPWILPIFEPLSLYSTISLIQSILFDKYPMIEKAGNKSKSTPSWLQCFLYKWYPRVHTS